MVKALRYKSEGDRFDSRWFLWNFSLTLSFRPHYGHGIDSASDRNEYQEYLMGVKAAGASGWQPDHHIVPIVLKSGSPQLPGTLSSPAEGLLYLLHILFTWPSYKDVSMDGACGTHGENRNACRFLVGEKLKVKDHLGKHKRISGGNIKLNSKRPLGET